MESLRSESPVLAPGSEELIWMGERTLLKVTGEMTNGLYSIAEVFATPDGMVPLHVHNREDEAFYLLEGDLTVQVGDARYDAHPGSLVFGPKGVAHRYWVKSPTARLLMIFSPAGFEGFIRATSGPEGPLEIDLDKVLAAAAEYGTEVLG